MSILNFGGKKPIKIVKNEKTPIRVLKAKDILTEILEADKRLYPIFNSDEAFQAQCKDAASYLFNCTNYEEFNKFPKEVGTAVLAHIIARSNQTNMPKYGDILNNYFDIPTNGLISQRNARYVLLKYPLAPNMDLSTSTSFDR